MPGGWKQANHLHENSEPGARAILKGHSYSALHDSRHQGGSLGLDFSGFSKVGSRNFCVKFNDLKMLQINFNMFKHPEHQTEHVSGH